MTCTLIDRSGFRSLACFRIGAFLADMYIDLRMEIDTFRGAKMER